VGDTVTEGKPTTEKKSVPPKVLVFSCNWSTYPGLQLSRLDGPAKSSEPIITMCAGRLDPELILEAFSRGAWGVFVAGCPPEECEHDGNYKTRRRILLLKKVLGQLGVEPERLALEWVSTGESAKLTKLVGDFTARVAQLGPQRR
jgi:F420-non-reducing hydrogenase iron-sulfur subunit